MRRSAAPSQFHSAKRSKFATPFIGKRETGLADKDASIGQRSASDTLKIIKDPERTPCATTGVRNTTHEVNQLENVSAKDSGCWLQSGKSDNVAQCRADKTVLKTYDVRNNCDTIDSQKPEINCQSVLTDMKKIENDADSSNAENNSKCDEITENVSSNDVNDKSLENCITAQKSKPVFLGKKASFRPPLSSVKQEHRTGMICSVESMIKSEEQSATRYYYSVMWCKLSKKKHKKWEGDAVLVTSGRSVTLQDMEGKEIGKCTGYKSAELSSLAEGHTLVIGGKEIEVMGAINEEHYNSGKCFQQATSSSHAEPTSKMNLGPSKPFMKPRLSSGTDNDQKENIKTISVITPKFDPMAPDALVMPRPNQTHQWQYNKNKVQIVDVVVDPHLTVHLRPHQRDGVVFLYESVMGMKDYAGHGAILADDMGLGKTLQCISTIWTMYKQGPYGGKAIIKKILIVTPGSLVKNWCKEFKKWLGTERISVFAVSSDNRVDEFLKSPIYPVLAVSYEMLVRCYDDICKVNFDLIVCDEGHRLKNTTIKTTSLISNLPTKRRIVLTGTPIQNDLQEFYSIVEFCNPGILGSSAAFRRVYEAPIVSSKQPSASAADIQLGKMRAAELSRLTSLFILRRTQEINNKYLPPKLEMVVFCKPSPLQLSIYHKLISSRLVKSCLYNTSDGTPHLICIGALKKLCNHPSLIYNKVLESEEDQAAVNFTEEEDSLYHGLMPLYPDHYSTQLVYSEHSGKLNVVRQLLSAMSAQIPREKIVLVSNYTQTLDLLQKLCETESYSYVRLDGQTPTSKRQAIVEHFNSRYSQDFVFLLSSKAGGTGLNLIGASRLLLYDIDWNPANDLQAMARVWRDGQRKKVFIYRLLTTGTIEEKVYQRQVSKQGLSGTVVDSKMSNNVQFSREALKDIFKLREDTLCDTHELLKCGCCLGESSEVSTSDVVSRSCQLGLQARSQAGKKHLSMDELKDWKHVQEPTVKTFTQDDYLIQASDNISFVFWHESNHLKTTDFIA